MKKGLGGALIEEGKVNRSLLHVVQAKEDVGLG